MITTNYKSILLGIGILFNSSISCFSQTNYGTGSGTKGYGYSYFGVNAGSKSTATTGDNTFIGYNAGENNTNGAFNTFVGSSVGGENRTGKNNTFLGYGTGIFNNGDNNTFIGAQAGVQNINGAYNIFIGFSAGRSSNGSKNVYIGQGSGSFDVNSTLNTFLGFQTGVNITSASYNTFLGAESGYSNKTGEQNVFIGYRTGFTNNAGQNVFIGYTSGFSNNVGKENVFVGNQAGYWTNAGQNVFLGYGSGYNNIMGESNTFVGNQSGSLNKTGSQNTYIGYLATGLSDLENATAIGSKAIVLTDNSLVLGYNSNVGIGTAAPTYQLHLTKDDAGKPGSNVWTVISDKRLKKDIAPFQEGLSTITKINPVWFSYNGQAGTPTDNKKFVGVIAQDMQQIAPYTVGKYVYIDSTKREEYLDYDGNAITYMLINSVKELDNNNKELVQIIEKQNQRISQLEQKLSNQSIQLNPNTILSTGAELYQNVPNPFSAKTEIGCYIPEEVQSVSIFIFDMNGKKLKSIPVTGKGKTSITIEARELNPGMYFYSLIVDGKEADVKRMIIE